MKRTKTLTGMLAILFISIANITFAKNNLPPPASFPALLFSHCNSLDWNLDATVSNVELYHAISECNGKKVVFLKFNNKNSGPVTVYWKEVFITQEKNAEKTEGPFGEKQLVLSSGETFSSGCDDIKQKELLARPDQITPVYQAEIIKFNFQDIRVTQ